VQEPRSTTGLQRGQGCALFGTGVAAMAVFVAPYVLGPIGLVLGVIAYLRGERRGRWVVVLAIVCTALGLLLSLLPDKFVSN
jgi:hypothetical protein